MHNIGNRYATVAYRFSTEDDISDVDDAAGLGGIVITGLSSDKPGNASIVLKMLVDKYPDKHMAVIAYARSGDHERLYELYGRFGFKAESENCPSLRVL